jgi:DNA processing protein
MFASADLVSTRERAATLALLAQRRELTARGLPWNRVAGAIEDAEGALNLLRRLDEGAADRLFVVEEKKVTLDQLEEQVLAYEAEGITVVTVLDDAYPANLRMVHDRPPVLFVGGELSDQDERSVAVVGTRRASEGGVDQTRRIAGELVEAEYVVVSGLAAGIDTASHQGALDAGGRTVAVIGTGLRETFPKENAPLQDRIGREAAVISQFWPGQGARKWTFPERNAVMSGFARATVVVEAGRTSGARMQARLALEHGRPVFLLWSLVAEHDWAKTYRDYPGVYVVESGREVIEHLDRLYAKRPTLVA